LKYLNSIRGAIGALVMLVVVAAHAEVSESGTQPPTPESSITDKKAIRAENRRLQKAVMRSLSATKGLEVTNMLVVARSGTVTLAGSVPEGAQADLAVLVAKGVAGVSEVKSVLTIRPEGQ
jgi:hyperosmotically inducible periplasmic protein